MYGRYWNEAPQTELTPLKDANFLKQIKSYLNENIRSRVLKALCFHLRYFSEKSEGFTLKTHSSHRISIFNKLKFFLIWLSMIVKKNQKPTMKFIFKCSKRLTKWKKWMITPSEVYLWYTNLISVLRKMKPKQYILGVIDLYRKKYF